MVGDLARERLLLMSPLAPCGWKFGAGAHPVDELSPTVVADFALERPPADQQRCC